MKDEVRKHLHDIQQAAAAIKAFAAGHTFDDYVADDLARLLEDVERLLRK